MAHKNPYAAPSASLESAGEEFYQPKILSTSGRLGRLRYLAYGTGAQLLLMAIMLPLAMLTGAQQPGQVQAAGAVGMILMVVFYIAMIVLMVIFAKRRMNDLDRSGWWLLLFIVPIANLILALFLVFAPGTKAPNGYGPIPVKNPIGVVILGLALPILAIVGIVMAIAIPAYMQYVQQAGM